MFMNNQYNDEDNLALRKCLDPEHVIDVDELASDE